MCKKVIVFTQTHNNEKTLHRCIDSIINQTYGEFVYYIADNASTDSTKEIISQYAEQDKRIIPVYCNDNLIWQIYTCLPEILAKYDINDCLIVLDSDDEYIPDAFEKLLRFMAEGDLEVAACTTDYIDGDDGSDLNRQVLENNLIISGLNFEAQFPEYFKFVRDSWGKMFSLSLFSHLEFQSFNHTIQHGSTSILSFEALCNSKRFGVLAQRLHKYYIYTHSLEQSGSTRISAPMLYKYYRDWVISKCGQLNDLNKRFLYGAYFRAIKNRTLPLIHSNIGLKEKLGLLRMVFDDILTTEMMSCDQIDGVSSENKAEYIGIVLSWVDSICFEEETEESLLCAYIRHRLEQM